MQQTKQGVSFFIQNYSTLYQRSIKYPDEFWSELAHRYLKWRKPFKKVMQCNMKEGDIKWFLEGKLNVSGEQCIESLCCR